MKKIRVLHILDELNTGGAERIVFTYYQNIDRNKYQWDFVMTRYEDANKRGILEKKIEQMGGKIYRVHRKRENYIKNINDIDRIIKNGKYDIVHSHLDELSAFYLLSAKRYKVPVRICHSHLAGTSRGRYVEMFCKIIKPIMNKVTTDKFACGTDAAVALWGKKAVDNGEVHIMRNAINTSLFRFSKELQEKKRREFNIDNDTFVIGSVGRLSYQKNSLYIVDVFYEFNRINPKSRLLLVGVGDLIEEIKLKIAEYGLENNVELLGNRDDVNEIMMAMDAFILPSRFEGLPIVMVEAQCAGLQCFVSNNITKEIKLSKNTKYISLTKNAKMWAEIINKNIEKYDRSTGIKDVIDGGYEILNAVNDLDNYYIRTIEGKNEKNI